MSHTESAGFAPVPEALPSSGFVQGGAVAAMTQSKHSRNAVKVNGEQGTKKLNLRI